MIAKRGVPILGDLDYFDICDPDVSYIVGLGSPAERRSVDRALSKKGFGAATVIHPTAVLSPYVGTINAGCYIGPLAVIQTEATLERHVHVGTHVDVGHDNVLGAYTTVSPGVMSLGHVRYGEGVMVGASATILPKQSIGSWCTVGAGAVVREDVDRGLTVVGVPARPVSERLSAHLEL